MANNVRIPITATDKTAAAFKSVGRRMGSLTGKIAKMGAAFGVAGVGVGAALVKSSMNSIDQLGKMADKIGTSTEALGRMRYAAELTGVSQQTLDMAMQRFTRRLAEASIGTGEARGALMELGLSANQMLKLPLDKQMEVLAGAMAGAGTQADRVRLSMKLFDSEGVALVNTLNEGAGGLQEMGKEAEALGILLSRADVKAVEQANDELQKSFLIFQNIFNQIAVDLAPWVTALATRFRQVSIDAGGFGDIGQKVLNAITAAVTFTVDAMHTLQKIVLGMKIAWAHFEIAGLAAFNVLMSPISVLMEGINMVKKALGEPIDEIPWNTALFESVANLETLQAEYEALTNAAPAGNAIATFFEEIKLGAREAADAINNVNASNQNNGKEIKKLTFLERQKLKGEEEAEAFRKMSATEQTGHVIGEMSSLFKKNKAFNIANAVMQTYAGATKALSAYPPPIGFAMAAAVVASGMQNIAQIKSQSYEGGGFTGRGARAGGIDGKGGFLSVLHPNESITDHTKGGGGITIVNNIDAKNADSFTEMRIRAAIEESSQATVAKIINLSRRGRLA
tara:strand:- start:722 stop:2422 length:1701 start_codon:yes stop_codon:yes gene_type:complete